MDPTCGSSTFLMEAARCWGAHSCTLIANDIELSLIELSMLTLGLATSPQCKKYFSCSDIYLPSKKLQEWYGQIDYILANPPFSLQIDYQPFNSPLFSHGYRNSDALFIDIALELLRPGGRLVCVLPHSIIANKEYADFRAIVEKSTTLLGVICLPEGVFQLSAGTTTRVDIVVLEKSTSLPLSAQKHFFSSTPAVGIKLNGNGDKSIPNHLQEILETRDIKSILGI